MKRILVTARSFGQSDDGPVKLLESRGLEVVRLGNKSPLDAAALRSEIAGFSAVIAGLDEFDRSVMESAPGLRVISRYGVGYDKVDLAAARELGIIVTTTPGANDASVADLAMTLLLSAARLVPFADRSARSGGFERKMGVELWQKTLGVIGLGRIGRGVVTRAGGFSMNILCHDVAPDEDFVRERGIRICALEELLQTADFVTIHAPLTPETRGMIGRRQLAMMKGDAVLVNTARGGIVDERALYEALRDGVILAAALDVTENEPPVGSPLLTLDNCIVTSHIGGFTKDAVLRMGMTAAQNAIDVLETGKCVHQIG